jgi:5-deoxy-glucuronate isomerase
VNTSRHLRASATADGPWRVSVTPERAGWDYSGLRVLGLPAGGSHAFGTAADEVVILPLAGSCVVECDGERFNLAGRTDVFSGVTDFAYLPRDSPARISSPAGGRFALASARARRRLAPQYGPASGVPVELRGAGSCSRRVDNFCMPSVFPADRLIACEVITPAGNWSSFPPHKHDQDRPGESVLEEIYYFEIAAGPAGPGVGFQRVYGTADRPADLLAEVRDGDVVLIPHGWHGPSMAAPGYDMYYLNVMAGPAAERAWLASDDPAHAWVRDTWRSQQPDPRLTTPGPLAGGAR